MTTKAMGNITIEFMNTNNGARRHESYPVEGSYSYSSGRWEWQIQQGDTVKVSKKAQVVEVDRHEIAGYRFNTQPKVSEARVTFDVIVAPDAARIEESKKTSEKLRQTKLNIEEEE